jgi:transmembrane sensor
MISEAEFLQLLEKYHKDTLLETERDLLFQLVSDGQFSNVLKENIFLALDNPSVSGAWSREMEESVLAELLASVRKGKKMFILYPFRRIIAVAAIFLVVIGVAYFTWFTHPVTNKSLISQVAKKDIAPGKDGAVLTLSNGQQIVLDSAANGRLTVQGNTQVSKENGQIIYDHSQSNALETIAYNTLSTPRGRQFEVTLPDGTSVWLNAGSSITYPTSFTGKSREVSITGEVYFEVTKDQSMPFHVKVNNMDVTVLGTHFNINSYSNEASIKTTLLEGSVRVTKGTETGLLKPGQQAEINKAGNKISIHDEVDTDLAMAWKNGFTSFKSADIKSIMRQVERWYDVDVSFEGNIPLRTFTADVSRNAPVSEILKILDESKIHYKIEDKKIIVIP